jgi:C-terminal domain found in long catalases
VAAKGDKRGAADELHQLDKGVRPTLTTNQGIPVSDNQNSLRANAVGPTLLFDADAVILSAEGAALLTGESAALVFIGDAFGHLKAIAVDGGGEILLTAAGVEKDPGVVEATDLEGFIAAAKTRQWEREPKVRILA